jgi:flagellar biosynthetic protein FliR
MNLLPFTADVLLQQLLQLLWPFLRISAVLVAAPVLGASSLPVPVRVLLAFGLAALVAPLLPANAAVDPLTGTGLLLALEQVLLGVLMGFAIQMVFSTMAQAGEMIALSMGLGFASINDPQNGLQVPMVSQYYVIIATVVFLALDGHLALFALLFDSFRFLPIGGDAFTADAFWRLLQWGSTMFRFAVFIALPAVLALLLINLALGVMTRAAPQLNIFAVGFPIMLLAGMAAMFVTLPLISVHLERLLTAALTLITRL